MRSIACAVLALMFALPALAQEPLSRQLTLADMTQNAGTIVRGQVVDSRVESHPQFPNISTLRVTLRVLDPIYGVGGKQITYRLFLPPRFRQLQVPSEYRIGEELVLFMHKASQYGLTSPVGGAQGRFQVQHVNGQVRVVNGINNSGLFGDLARQAQTQGRQPSTAESELSSQQAGPVALNDFSTVVRQLAAGKVSQ